MVKREVQIAVCLLDALDASIALADWCVADEILHAIEALARRQGCSHVLDEGYARIVRLES